LQLSTQCAILKYLKTNSYNRKHWYLLNVHSSQSTLSSKLSITSRTKI